MARFGEIIRRERTRKGLSLQVLADKTRTFKGYICGIETGTLNPPSPKMVKRICSKLDLDYHEMLARSVFEKLPKGLPYANFEKLFVEASQDGVLEAPGKRRGW